MGTLLALLIASVVPVGTFFFLRGLRGDDPAYKRACSKLLGKGILLVFPVFGFSLLLRLTFGLTGLYDLSPVLRPVLKAVFLEAFAEEWMKHRAAKKTIERERPRVSFLDVMAFSAVSAIGFELLESVAYMFYTDTAQILVRGISNMHCSFGLIQGWLLARGYKNGRARPAVAAVLVPTAVHAVYNLLLDELFEDTAWGLVSLLIAVLCLALNVYAFFFVKRKKIPYYTDPLFPEEGNGEDGAADGGDAGEAAVAEAADGAGAES